MLIASREAVSARKLLGTYFYLRSFEMNKKLIASVIAGLGLIASGSASAITVGGVNFGNIGLLSHLETTTLAETIVNADGQELYGYGVINTVNGLSNYAGGDKLYFVFDQYISNDVSATNADFSGGSVRVYLRPEYNLLDFSSEFNFNEIDMNSGTQWVTLAGHTFFPPNATGPDTLRSSGDIVGAAISFTGSGLLDVVGGLGDVVAFLDTNTRPDGAGGNADILINTSGSNDILNPNDNTSACAQGGTPGVRATNWCVAGSADLRGATNVNVVPEPGMLALVGLGLLGMGISLRKRKSA